MKNKLPHGEPFFRSLFDHTPEAILVGSGEKEIIAANAAACRLFGWPEDEIRRRGPDLLIDPAEPGLRDAREDVRRTGRFQGALKLNKAGGGRFLGEVAAVGFREEDGSERIIATVREAVAGRGTAVIPTESDDPFHSLAVLAPVGIYLTDTKGLCLYANPRWCAMAGLSPEDALGEGWVRGVHPEDREAVFAAWEQTVRAEGIWGLEYRFQSPDGRVTWVHGLASPRRDAAGRTIGYIGINIDISERKRAEIESLILQGNIA